jgi:hypothetical protein
MPRGERGIKKPDDNKKDVCTVRDAHKHRISRYTGIDVQMFLQSTIQLERLMNAAFE